LFQLFTYIEGSVFLIVVTGGGVQSQATLKELIQLMVLGTMRVIYQQTLSAEVSG
jgi:hypothetical protein